MKDVYVDMLGQEIRAGDYVVYATTSGRSPVLKYAKVVKVDEVAIWSPGEDLTRMRVGVKEIKNGRGFTRWDARVPGASWKEQDMSKVRVTYPMSENIVKVEAATA